MRCLKFIILLAMVISVLAESYEVKSVYNEDEDYPVPESAEATSFRGVSRFLAQRTRVVSMKCNQYPRICRVKGSPGPDCCNKRCVDAGKDTFNCGKCGRKCKFSEICCKGKCVNPLTDKKNCGGCDNKCKKGSKCTYGMCSYA